MTSNPVRLQAITSVEAFVPPPVTFDPGEEPGEIFGENVFSLTVMQKRLPKSVYRSVLTTIEKSAPLDPAVADAVASAMKDWALEKGATHYAHVFYPLTGLTAEKHDSFLDRSVTAPRWRRSRERRWSRVSPTRARSPTAGCATPSRRAGTPAGT